MNAIVAKQCLWRNE